MGIALKQKNKRDDENRCDAGIHAELHVAVPDEIRRGEQERSSCHRVTQPPAQGRHVDEPVEPAAMVVFFDSCGNRFIERL